MRIILFLFFITNFLFGQNNNEAFQVEFLVDDIDCNGQINITGSFDNWSGWGANPNNNYTIELTSGSYEYQVLCINTSNSNWFNDPWNNSIIYEPEQGSSCDFNPDDSFTNFGFIVNNNIVLNPNNCILGIDELYSVNFLVDDIECDGQINITGEFDDWSGWGAHPDNNYSINLQSGDYQFVYLCIDTSIPNFWNNVWNNSTVINSEVHSNCDFNPNDNFGNFGFTVSNSNILVEFCNSESVLSGCTNSYASNYNHLALLNDGSCSFENLLQTSCFSSPGREESVRIENNKIIIGNEAFHMKGVCWSPTPIGGGPGLDDGNPSYFSQFVDQDAPLMQAAGINIVRTYGVVDEYALDVLYNHGIFVISVIYFGYDEPIENTFDRLCELKHHPAIIGWEVGNEWNLTNLSSSIFTNFSEALSMVDYLTTQLKYNDSTRLISTTWGGWIPDENTFNTLNNVDIYGLNLYVGESFLSLFQHWNNSTSKPFYLSEYGIDAFHTIGDSVNEEYQSFIVESLTNEIFNNASINESGFSNCTGGMVFEWNDEWWKHNGGDWSIHDELSSWSTGGFLDEFVSEEWFGIVDIHRTPRLAYTTYSQMTPPSSLNEVTFDVSDIDCNGLINISGDFNNFSGWGVTFANNFSIELENGSYEYFIQCVNNINTFNSDPENSSFLIQPLINSNCDFIQNNNDAYYGFTIQNDDLLVEFCTNSVDSIFGCTDSIAINYNIDANFDNGTCNYCPQVCCAAMTASCLACAECMSYEDYCSLYPSTIGCPILGCTDSSSNNYNPLADIDNDSCNYDCDFPWDVVVTDQNHSIFIQGSITTENENSFSEGSSIGVFYTDNYGENQCAGYSLIENGTIQIAVMGDDSSSDEIDGLIYGQEFNFLVWDPSLCNEYIVNPIYTSGPEYYTSNGITFISDFISDNIFPVNQEINFPAGWSMFSTYMNPSNTSLDFIFSDFVENLVIIKDYEGNAYLPEFNFNGIGNINIGSGYQIKLNSSLTIMIDGEYLVPENNPISLNQGWNIIGYLRISPSPVDQVMNELVDNNALIIVKDYSGSAYLPEFNFNGIGDLTPSKGYQLKTNQESVLLYLSNNFSY